MSIVIKEALRAGILLQRMDTPRPHVMWAERRTDGKLKVCTHDSIGPRHVDETEFNFLLTKDWRAINEEEYSRLFPKRADA